MDSTTEAWRRLGELLVARRLQLDGRYRNRKLFAEETGVEERLISDIEKMRRRNFSLESIARFEKAYAWAPGSIRAVIGGGEPRGTADRTGSAHLSATSSLTAIAGGDDERPEPPDEPPRDLPRILSGGYEMRSRTERAIIWLPDATPEEIQEVLLAWRRAHDATLAAERDDANPGHVREMRRDR